jgi:hypothetical protein
MEQKDRLTQRSNVEVLPSQTGISTRDAMFVARFLALPD